MDFGRQRGFLVNGEDPLEKVGCRKESYFLQLMYADVARDFVKGQMNQKIEIFSFVALPSPNTKKNHPK